MLTVYGIIYFDNPACQGLNDDNGNTLGGFIVTTDIIFVLITP